MDVPTKPSWQEEMAAADSFMMVGDSACLRNMERKQALTSLQTFSYSYAPSLWGSATHQSGSKQSTRAQPSTADAQEQSDIRRRRDKDERGL